MILGEIVGEELKGYEAAQTRILGLVDDAHATAAEFLYDPVMRDGLV
jgi:hypothetical protein